MADKSIVYSDAVQYWSSVSHDDDGVLGGFGNDTVVPRVDVQGSLAFVKRLSELSPNTFPQPGSDNIVLDVGAGVGRVSRDVLSKFASAVDLLEPAPPLLEKAREIESVVPVRNYFLSGLQDFVFPDYSYWCVWCQWCLGQVPDLVLVQFLEECRRHLQPGGLVIIKENNSSGDDIFDPEDSSVTRTHEKFKQLFARAGYRVLLTSLQKGMPAGLFPVRIYALAPALERT